MAFTLTSRAFDNGAFIEARYTCDGEDRSPELQWSGAPPETQSFALLVHDPDAPSGDYTHWILFDIPPTTEGIQEAERLDLAGVPGTNDFGKLGYGGPCPPVGHPKHHYRFELYALDTDSLGLSRGAKRQEFDQAIRGHVIEQATLEGLYRRAQAQAAA